MKYSNLSLLIIFASIFLQFSKACPPVAYGHPSISLCDPNLEDSDNDGIPNIWEIDNGLDPCDPTDALRDKDCDAILNLFEYQMESNPNDPNSPQVEYFRLGDSEERFHELVFSGYGGSVVIQMEGGDYQMNGMSYLFGVPLPAGSPTDSKRIMIQGGWNSDFSEYNPFCHPTRIIYSEFIFMGLPETDDLSTMIYDGLDISYVDDDRNGFTFSESFRSGVINLGFHNCAFHDNTGFVLDYRILNGAGPVNFNMINTSLRRNTISSAFILHEFTPPAQYNFINTVITEHFDDETPRGLLHFIHSDTAVSYTHLTLPTTPYV